MGFCLSSNYQDNQTEEQQTHVLQHHFRAEVDTRNNIFHGYTFKRRRIIDFLTSQKLQINEIIDFSDTKRMNSTNPKYMKTVIDGLKNSMEQAKNFPDSQNFIDRGDQILERIRTIGFKMPKQLIVLCKFNQA